MKRLIKSWKFYLGMIALGFTIWLAAGFFTPAPRVFYEMQKGAEPMGIPVPVGSIYLEIKFWAELVGKFLVGLGGVASAIRVLMELFRRKSI